MQQGDELNVICLFYLSYSSGSTVLHLRAATFPPVHWDCILLMMTMCISSDNCIDHTITNVVLCCRRQSPSLATVAFQNCHRTLSCWLSQLQCSVALRRTWHCQGVCHNCQTLQAKFHSFTPIKQMSTSTSSQN